MRKGIIFGSLLASVLLLMIPHISAVEYLSVMDTHERHLIGIIHDIKIAFESSLTNVISTFIIVLILFILRIISISFYSLALSIGLGFLIINFGLVPALIVSFGISWMCAGLLFIPFAILLDMLIDNMTLSLTISFLFMLFDPFVGYLIFFLWSITIGPPW